MKTNDKRQSTSSDKRLLANAVGEIKRLEGMLYSAETLNEQALKSNVEGLQLQVDRYRVFLDESRMKLRTVVFLLENAGVEE